MSFIDWFKNLFKKEEKEQEEEKQEQKKDEEEVTVESLAEEQKVIDKLYARDGLTDEVLDMQVALNEKRHKYDISDKNNLNEEGWSQ